MFQTVAGFLTGIFRPVVLAMDFKCSGIFDDNFITNLMLKLTVREF